MKTYKVQPLDLMQDINTPYHEPFIHELIEFEDSLCPARLQEAVDKLIAVFPLLKCRYDRASNTFVENEGFTAENILKTDDISERQALLTQSLDASEKLIQFTLSKRSLVITVSHLICDGSGFKGLLYLLCDFYNGREDGDFSHLMNRELSHLTENLTGTSGITAKMMLSMLGSYKNMRIYEKTEEESVCLMERKLAAGTMSKVHKAAKAQGATLNDVFLTAYARAIGRLYERKKVNIPCTVDLRKYAKGNAGIANLTGTYTLNVKIDLCKSFAESLSVVSEKMRKQKKTKNDIAGPMLLVSKYEKSRLDQFLNLYGGMSTSPFTDYTNLGILDEKKLVFDGASVKNAVGYGGMNKAPYFSIAISSFKGETTVSSMFLCGDGEKKKVERLLDAVIEEIGASTKNI